MTKNTTSISLSSVAAEKGGKCKDIFSTFRSKVEWECAQGHKWFATVSNVIHNNSWCPECKVSRGENICRIYLETIFKNKFVKTRPSWLLNENNNSLELDGYCSELGIAFEYNGEQHYSDNNPWHKDLEIRISWDKLKINLCEKYGVKLIIIPQLFTRLKLNSLKSFLKEEFLRLKIKIPNDFDSLSFDLSTMNESFVFKEIKEIAIKKGGECLSSVYLNSNSKLEFKCFCGYIWKTSSISIKSGAWCPQCSKVSKITLDVLNKIIEYKNGLLLSNDFKNCMDKVKIKCLHCNNIWETSPNKIKSGRWCPQCANKKRTGRPRKSLNV